MGGPGSGQHRASRRPLVEQQEFLSATALSPEWKRRGMPDFMEVHPANAPSATLELQFEGTRQPRGGGIRLWLRCPSCGSRRATLYLDRRFGLALPVRLACRECLDLRYKSQRLSMPDRWLYRAQKLFQRAGCSSIDDYYWRPKRMRWERFNRLIDEAELNENAAFGWRVRGLFKPESSFSRYLRKRGR